jgi:agmatine/peptidylarginine deiminase
MKFRIILLGILFITSVGFAQNLPNFMTKDEIKKYQSYVPDAGRDITPPPGKVRTMAEWEEQQAVLITWTSYTNILSQIVKYAQTECKVLIVCSDSASVKSYLTSQGVPLVNLRFLYASFNSIWCRDYGPWCIYSNNMDTMRIIDWIYNRPRPQDDLIPVYVAQLLNVPLHQMTTSPNNLTATGGNFMTDGNGTGFSSKLILTENSSKTEAQIDTMMQNYMGINRYILMNTLPYDEIHHIDMHMKLLDEETLLVGQYPAGVADGPQIDSNLKYIQNNFLTCYGKPYKVVRIPMPPNTNGQYPPSGDYFTYTNSLIVNKTVIVPTYGVSQDTTALRIYREAMPGYRVVGIQCNSIISSLGAIHCITKEIGVYEPIFISHSAIRSATTSMPNYEVKALIQTKSGVSNAKCFWTTDTTAGFTPITMTSTADTFRAYIPQQPVNTKIYYYIQATSVSGRSISKPITAPSGNYRFTVQEPTIAGNGNTILLKYELGQNYPNPFNPSTNIKFAISKSGFVSLKIYDVLGREVSALINEFRQAGEYSVEFNANNFTSGIYFYKITSGDYTEVKKMVLMK